MPRLTHEVVNLLQFAHPNGLDRCFDQSSAEEVDSFSGVFAIANIGSSDGDHPNDSLKDWGSKVGSRWQTDYNDSTVGSNILTYLSA